MSAARWPAELVDERWTAMNVSEREAWLRFGSRQASWESVPDAAYRILKADRNVTLEGARSIDTIFRAAYESLAGDPE